MTGTVERGGKGVEDTHHMWERTERLGRVFFFSAVNSD